MLKILEKGSLWVMTSPTTRWLVLKECVVELGATNTALVTCTEEEPSGAEYETRNSWSKPTVEGAALMTGLLRKSYQSGG